MPAPSVKPSQTLWWKLFTFYSCPQALLSVYLMTFNFSQLYSSLLDYKLPDGRDPFLFIWLFTQHAALTLVFHRCTWGGGGSRNENIFCLGTQPSWEVTELLFMVIFSISSWIHARTRFRLIPVLLLLTMLFEDPPHRENKNDTVAVKIWRRVMDFRVA